MDANKINEIEPIPEGGYQCVVGSYSTEFVWRIPEGINLRDTETYEYNDRWGTLHIYNKKTQEEWHIDSNTKNEDFKYAHDLEVCDYDEDGCQI